MVLPGLINRGFRREIYSSETDTYDEYFSGLIETLMRMTSSDEIWAHLRSEIAAGVLEDVSGIIVRYKEYYIHNMSSFFGERCVEDYKIVNRLGLGIFPKMVECLSDKHDMFLVTKIRNNLGKKITDCPNFVPGKLSWLASRHVVRELVRLELNGYVLHPRYRYCVQINDDGMVVIPEFQLLKVDDLSVKEVAEIHSRYELFCVNGSRRPEWPLAPSYSRLQED